MAARQTLHQSFRVHELVHFLQYLEQGVELNSSCQAILDNETEAQLRRFGRPVRGGLLLPGVRRPSFNEAHVKPEPTAASNEVAPVLKSVYLLLN